MQLTRFWTFLFFNSVLFCGLVEVGLIIFSNVDAVNKVTIKNII